MNEYACSPVKRAIIIGCPGSGKSTFGRKLAAATGIPLHYLDMVWHRPDRTTVSRDEFDLRLDEIMSADEWIIDGNYLRTLPLRLRKCDTVFMFDLPLEVCLAGAEERLGKDRVDMPWTDVTMDEEFRQWILDFPEQQLPVINILIGNYSDRVSIVRFRTRAEADEYIARLSLAKE